MEQRCEEVLAGHAAMVEQIARVAAEGGLDIDRLGELLRSRYGEINLYPGEPTDACHPLAWFVALEGPLGREIQRETRPPRFPFWWLAYQRAGWYGDDLYLPHPPYGFTHTLELFVRHMQGCCGGITRQAVIVTDTWIAPVYERWRGNIERIRGVAHVEGYLVGAGRLYERLF
jgi:hypothetical protein